MVKKMRISKVYTKFGDKGNTMLVSGEVISKSSDRVESYGEVDELNSALGVACSGNMLEEIKEAHLLSQKGGFCGKLTVTL